MRTNENTSGQAGVKKESTSTKSSANYTILYNFMISPAIWQSLSLFLVDLFVNHHGVIKDD